MTKSATKPERERWSWFQDIGCLACRQEGYRNVPADIAHETDGGRRTGHQFTAPLCEYHHRGILPDGTSYRVAEGLYGPSFAYNKKAFERRYGTERELAERTDKLIEEHKSRVFSWRSGT